MKRLFVFSLFLFILSCTATYSTPEQIDNIETSAEGEKALAAVPEGENPFKVMLHETGLLLDDEVELTVTGGEDIPLAGIYTGSLGVYRYFLKFNQAIGVSGISCDYTIKDAENHSIHLTITGTKAGGSDSFEMEYIYLVHHNGENKIDEITIFYNTAYFYDYMNDLPGSDIIPATLPMDKNYTKGAEVLNAMFTPWAAGDVTGVLNVFDDDIKWLLKNDPRVVPYAGLKTGHDGFLDYLNNLMPNVTIIESGFSLTIVEGNKADYFMFEHNKTNSTGKESKIIGALAFTVNPETDKISSCVGIYESKKVRDTFYE